MCVCVCKAFIERLCVCLEVNVSKYNTRKDALSNLLVYLIVVLRKKRRRNDVLRRRRPEEWQKPECRRSPSSKVSGGGMYEIISFCHHRPINS